ncbi:MAG: hypothetical protein ACREKH_12070 [Candidatus Rokuibacteriota bacterium]
MATLAVRSRAAAWGTEEAKRASATMKVRGSERTSMNVERSRIALLAGAAAVAVTGGLWSSARAQPLGEVTVYKGPT